MTATANRWSRSAAAGLATVAAASLVAGTAAAAVAATGSGGAPPGSQPDYASRNLCAPPSDTVPPEISNVSVSPQTVDLNSGPRTVTVTADATDTSANGAASGVKRIFVFAGGKRSYARAKLSLSSGTTTDGEWTGTLTVPADAVASTWQIRGVDAIDTAGNDQDYEWGGSHPRSPNDIELQTGWQTSFTVTGQGTPPPPKVRAGKLTSFTFTPSSVNATETSARVNITATFSKHMPDRVFVDWEPVSGRPSGFNSGVRLKPSGGDAWTGHLTVGRWLGRFEARPEISAEYAANARPRFRHWTADQLEARHFPSYLRVKSGVDKTKPTLQSLSFAPTSIDTTGGAQTLTVTATAADTGSGVRQVRASFSIRDGSGGVAGGFYPYPGLGYASNGYVNVNLKQQSDGQWVGTGTFPECTPGGTWHASIFMNDHARNYANYSWKKLQSNGFPGTVKVTSTPGDVEAPYVRDATAAGVSHTITLDFTEGVKNVDTSTLAVYAAKPASSRFQQSESITAIECSNGSAVVDCSGSGGLVTSAILTVPSLQAGSEYLVFGNLDAVTPQLTDGAGNPLEWNYQAADVTGS